MLPVLISVPHGGEVIPPEIAGCVALSYRDIFIDGDALTRIIYDVKNDVEAFIEMPIARAIIDLNRDPGDRPPQNADGVVKTCTTMLKPVYKNGMFPDERLVRRLMDQYYYPYHREIDELQHKNEFIISLDCHSMLRESPPISGQKSTQRPIICLSNGGDENGEGINGCMTTCPPELLRKMAICFCEAFEIGTRDVLLNNPFRGGYIVHSHSGHKKNWIQVEINRSLYLTEPYFDKHRLVVDSACIQKLRDQFLAVLNLFVEKIK